MNVFITEECLDNIRKFSKKILFNEIQETGEPREKQDNTDFYQQQISLCCHQNLVGWSGGGPQDPWY